MTQNINPSRLTKMIELGSYESVPNSVGVTVSKFVSVATVHAGLWSRSITQAFEVYGTDLQHTDMYVIRHRQNYDGITRVKVDGVDRELVDVLQDPTPNQTSFDLLTVRKVTAHGK